MIKRMLILCACLTLFTGTALGETQLIPQLTQWSLETADITITANAELTTWLPFDETTVATLNLLLSHLSLQTESFGMGEETWSRTSVLVDGTEALSLVQRETPEQNMLNASFLPKQTLVSTQGDPVELLLGDSTEANLGGLTGTEDAIRLEALTLIEKLPDALAEWMQEKSISKKIENMGKATLQRTFTASSEDAQRFGTTLTQAAGTGRIHDFLSGLLFTEKQTITLYYSAEGELLRVAYTGRCGASEDAQRKVTLTWSMHDDGEEARDTLTLKSPAVSGSDRDTITWKRVLDASGDNRKLEETLRYEYVRSKQKTVLEAEAELSNAFSDTETLLSGEMWVKETLPDDSSQTWVVRPEITLALPGDTPEAFGTLQYVHKKSKKVSEEMTIQLSMRSGQGFAWENRSETVALDSMIEENLTALQQQGTETMAAKLVQALLQLPQEDLLFLSDGLSEEAWQNIMDALSGG